MLAWRRGGDGNPVRGAHPTTRLIALAAFAFLWAVAVLFRLIQLQVVSHATYVEAARRQQQHAARLDAARGTIYDRAGRILAKSVLADSISINPLRVPDRPLAAEILARVLGVDRQELLEKMDSAVESHRLALEEKRKPKGTGFLWVKRKISPAEAEALKSLKLDWVEFQKEPHRYYPDGSLASHVVGTVDFQERGNLGLERKLDDELRGRPGHATMLTDVLQRAIDSRVDKPPEAGKDLTLTLDQRIQFVVDRELRAACEKHRAVSGSLVVMNPYTGEVLAMASYPRFDANEPPQQGEPASVRFDHPVSVAFEPGSVFKIITLSAALETTALRPESPINCGGGTLVLFGRVIHEAKRGYGTLSMADVLAKSSNIGAIQIGLKVGPEKLLEYVRRFGFGKATGIPLPAESTGMVRDLRWWGKSSIGSVAMGHEVSTTTLQLAQACSVIANGGLLVKPRLVLKRQRPGEKPDSEPAGAPKRILKPETAITMRQMMEGVVLHGTGKAARLAGYTSGGKTGSAQIFDLVTKHYSHLYNGSFVGFAPVTNPAVVIAVSLNGVKLFGGVVAAPVFKTIATETLRLLGVPKDIPEVEPEPLTDPEEANDVAIADLSTPPDDLEPLPPSLLQTAPPAQAAPAQPATLAAVGAVPGVLAPQPSPNGIVAAEGPKAPSFQGKTVREVLEEALAGGIAVEVIGSGVARAQAPAPGTMLRPSEKVRVNFQ